MLPNPVFFKLTSLRSRSSFQDFRNIFKNSQVRICISIKVYIMKQIQIIPVAVFATFLPRSESFFIFSPAPFERQDPCCSFLNDCKSITILEHTVNYNGSLVWKLNFVNSRFGIRVSRFHVTA